MKKSAILILCLVLSIATGFAQQAATSHSPIRVCFTTNVGKFTIELSDLTPKHRDNFIRLVKEGGYKDVLFHRVIDQFMIQTGNLQSKGAPKLADLSEDSSHCTLPAEIVYPELFHTKGVVAAAREGDDVNPEMNSSCTQFYIVTGKFFTAYDLDKVEERTGKKIPLKIREIYMLEGGTPHLDGKYTVFGRIISGYKTIEKISSEQTDGNNRPLKDIRIKKAEIVSNQ